MDLGSAIAKSFRMSDEVWERHANPWSVWTRVPLIVPLLAAIWSIKPLGWSALIPLGLVCAWIWLNPRVFPKPASTDNWASKAVLGERVWLARDRHPVPLHHQRMANILSAIAAIGFIPAAIGACLNDWTMTLAGGVTAFLGKLWFCDRMVWLYEDMKDVTPTYRSWLK